MYPRQVWYNRELNKSLVLSVVFLASSFSDGWAASTAHARLVELSGDAIIPLPTTPPSVPIPSDSQGSSFNEVWSVVLDKDLAPSADPKTREIMDGYNRGELPRYEVSKEGFRENGVKKLDDDAVRTMTDPHDYLPGFAKRLHSNGICFAGVWTMTEPSPYSGYFSQGRRALIIGRASVTRAGTRRGERRGFAFAGKVFPTMDASAAVRTANFFQIETLAGDDEDKYFLDAGMSNEPDSGLRFSDLWNGTLAELRDAGKSLDLADKMKGVRQLYPLSELGLTQGSVPKTPRWMMMKPAPGTAKNTATDFREELDLKNHPGGLVFDVFVSDDTKDPTNEKGWARIGRVILSASAVSYGCDRRLHFTHPKFRD